MSRLTAEQLAAYASGHYTDDRRDMAAEILELRAECERLRKHLKGANSGFEQFERMYYLESDKVEQLTRERDAAREFNRRFRFSGKSNGVDEYEFWAVARDYDATQAQTPQPPQTEWVPWTSETFPADCEWLLDVSGNKCRITHVGKDGVSICGRNHVVFMSWLDIQTTTGLKCSHDGVTWNRCGTEVTK